MITGEPMRRSVRAFNLDGGVGLGGFDPVSYRNGAPVEGEVDLAVVHQGATYRFASEENRAAFLAAPAQYEPAFGGWCAWAMARGKRVEVDPRAYMLDGDTLYLFNDASRRESWKAEAAALGPQAAAAWAQLTR